MKMPALWKIAPFLSAVTILPASADSPQEPVPLVVTSEDGSDVFFTMTPGEHDENYRTTREPVGVARRLGRDNKLVELYRTKGWYASELHLSRDGRCLVRMGPWNMGKEPEDDDLAVAFYRDGKLLKKYSTAALVRDKTKVATSVSHYFWQAPSPYREKVTGAERLALRPSLSYFNTFNLHTIDGWSYSFDAENGNFKTAIRTKEFLKQ